MAFIKESVSFLSVPNKSIFKDVIVLNHPPNFQTAPASSLIHKNGNPLSIYHHPSETPCSSSFQGGDRLFSTYHLIIHLLPSEMNMPAYKYKLVCK